MSPGGGTGPDKIDQTIEGIISIISLQGAWREIGISQSGKPLRFLIPKDWNVELRDSVRAKYNP